MASPTALRHDENLFQQPHRYTSALDWRWKDRPRGRQAKNADPVSEKIALSC